MELKPGYKQTEFGLIPEDWQVELLGQHATFRTGPFGSALHKSDYVNDGVPVINPMHIVDGYIEPTSDMTISETAAESLYQFRLCENEIVIGRRGDMGRCAVVQSHQSGWLCGTGSMIVRSTDFNPKFLQRVLSSKRVIAAIVSNSVGTTMVNLNQGSLSSLKVQYPALPEQSAIATALSDVDALLSAQDALIAKQRAIKQGAMQELLTGKRRLPGFGGEWKGCSLKQLADIRPGINKPLSHMGSGALYVTVQDLYDGTSIRTERLSRIMVTPSEIEARSLIPGDIVFGKSSVKREGIGYPSQFHGCDEPVVFSGFAYRARAHHTIADAEFLFYGLRSERTRRWLIDNSQASALTNINQTIADAIPIDLPPTLTEQAAIAKILKDMDAAIEELETKREKTALLKQGMMQELLTGRIRLV